MQGSDSDWKFATILADAAQVSDGKLYILGGGWQIIGPQLTPFALAIIVGVPWTETNRRHKLVIKLLDADGKEVTLSGAPSPLEISTNFELGRPPGIVPGTRLNLPIAINLPPLPLSAGTYEWVWLVNDAKRDDWRVSFAVRSASNQA